MLPPVHLSWTLLAVGATVLAIATAVTFAQQPAPSKENLEPIRTGNITGKVVNETDQPLANVAVLIRSFGSPIQGGSTFTDKEGNFRVPGLDAAAYEVLASAPSYASMPRDPDSDQTFHRVGDFVKVKLIKGGVITGTVTTMTGEPIVGVAVRAFMVRDVHNRPSRYVTQLGERTTDDRGVYRIYGLVPGTYVVSAGGSAVSPIDAHGLDVPTYAPSSSRDTAAEINVRAGEESNNVDIRYRGEQGHIVSGTVSGAPAGTPAEYMILLSSVLNEESQPTNYSYQSPTTQGFTFYGVTDGDYYLTAQLLAVVGHEGISENRQIKVRGGDISGIELITKPLASITGRVILEESSEPECKDKRRPVFSETVIMARHNEKSAKDGPRFQWAFGTPKFPDKQGEFTIPKLAPGKYRFDIRTFAKYWYLRSISIPSSASARSKTGAAKPVIDAAQNWTRLKFGEQISGLRITLAAGAASILGRIKLAAGEEPAARLFVYLVPAERERADKMLEFFASQVAGDGTFSLNHLVPGRYRVFARIMADNNSAILSKLRSPDEFDFRVKLRGEAQAGNTEIELKPCQNVTGFELPAESKRINVPK